MKTDQVTLKRGAFSGEKKKFPSTTNPLDFNILWVPNEGKIPNTELPEGRGAAWDIT